MTKDQAVHGQENQSEKEPAAYKDPGVLLIMSYFLIIIMALVVGKV